MKFPNSNQIQLGDDSGWHLKDSIVFMVLILFLLVSEQIRNLKSGQSRYI